MQTTLDSWEAAVRYLISRGAIDPKRIGVSGHSFGDKAVWYALSHSSLFSVAINNGGSDDDPVSYYTGGPGSVTRWGNNDWMKLPAPNDDPAHLWARISGALNADKIVAPVLIQVSDTEYDEIPDIYVSMLDAKKPVDLYVFTGEGHQFRQPHHRVIRAERNLEWFRFWFDHFEDSAPAKKDQYRYWETLCVKQLSAYPDRKLRCVRP